MKQVRMITTVLLPKKSCYLKLGISKNIAIYLCNQWWQMHIKITN